MPGPVWIHPGSYCPLLPVASCFRSWYYLGRRSAFKINSLHWESGLWLQSSLDVDRLIEKHTSPCTILYIMTFLFLIQPSSKDVHWRISRIDATLLVLWVVVHHKSGRCPFYCLQYLDVKGWVRVPHSTCTWCLSITRAVLQVVRYLEESTTSNLSPWMLWELATVYVCW